MVTAKYRDHPPPELEEYIGGDDERTRVSFRREVSRRIKDVVQRGYVNWCGEVTLAVAALTTTVVDDLVDQGSVIFFLPKTLNAANIWPQLSIGDVDMAPGAPWAANQVGQFTINHPNPLPADCIYRYAILG